MRKDVKQIMDGWGTELILEKAGEQYAVKAFLQEHRSKSQEYTQQDYGPLGERPRGIYLYIGPAEPAAEEKDLVRYGEKILEFRRAEPVMLGSSVLYIRGLCVEKGGQVQWGE